MVRGLLGVACFLMKSVAVCLLNPLPPTPIIMSMPEESLTRTLVTFELRKKLADRLRDEACQVNSSPGDLINSILSDYFSSVNAQKTIVNGMDSREHKRIGVDIPAFIEVNVPVNETQFKRVTIIDISSGGMCFKMSNNSRLVVEMIQRGDYFSLVFCVPSVSGVVEVICKPVHVTSNGSARVGAKFVNFPNMLKYSLDSLSDCRTTMSCTS